jgi:hypothetical protein
MVPGCAGLVVNLDVGLAVGREVGFPLVGFLLVGFLLVGFLDVRVVGLLVEPGGAGFGLRRKAASLSMSINTPAPNPTVTMHALREIDQHAYV